MLFNRGVRVVAPFVLVTLGLGMTACSSDVDVEPTPTVVTGTQSDAEPAPAEPTPADSDPVAEPSETTPSEASEDDIGPNDESGVVDVTVTGDQGILALQHSGAVPSGDAGPTDQKLITGPGGCFALTHQGEAQLLVFPADATFVLQEGKPSATIAGTEYLVGRQFGAATTAVPMTSVAGVPDRCMQGSDETVLVVN